MRTLRELYERVEPVLGSSLTIASVLLFQIIYLCNGLEIEEDHGFSFCAFIFSHREKVRIQSVKRQTCTHIM